MTNLDVNRPLFDYMEVRSFSVFFMDNAPCC